MAASEQVKRTPTRSRKPMALEAVRDRVTVGQPKTAAWPSIAAMAAAIVGLLGWLYWPVLTSLVRQWTVDGNASHGFLIPFMSAYLVWERRAALSRSPLVPSWWGAGVMLVGLATLIIGQVGAELFLQRMSLLIVLAGLVLLLLGKAVLRLWAFPLAFLIFMVPLPAIVLNAVAFPLQGFAAQTAASCLVTLNIPVLREGNVITLARTTLEVAEACSGIRSLMALLALGTAYAYFSERRMWKRWLIVAAAIPVAIAANAFRVAGTGILAHYFGDEVAEGFYHDFSGWLVFVVAFGLLVMVSGVVSRLGRPGAA